MHFLWINPVPIVDFINTCPKAFGEYAKGSKTLGTLSCNNIVQGYLEPILQENTFLRFFEKIQKGPTALGI